MVEPAFSPPGGPIVAVTPHIIGYHPTQGVALLGFRVTHDGLHLADTSFFEAGTPGLLQAGDIVDVPVQRAHYEEGEPNALFFVEYYDVPGHVPDLHSLSNVATLAEAWRATVHEAPPIRTFEVVGGNQFRETTPSSDHTWQPVPQPLRSISDRLPSPAPSLEDLRARFSPSPDLDYAHPSFTRDIPFLRTVHPKQAVDMIFTALDHPQGVRAAGVFAGTASYLLTRDIPTRDVAIHRFMAEFHPDNALVRRQALIDLARGSTLYDQQRHLYAIAAFASLAAGSPTVETEAILRHAGNDISLADIVNQVIRYGEVGGKQMRLKLVDGLNRAKDRETLYGHWGPADTPRKPGRGPYTPPPPPTTPPTSGPRM